MPSHASDTHIENAIHLVYFFSIGWRNRGLNFQVVPKFCIFLYISMEASDICQRVRIVYSAVMTTVFNSNDGWHLMP